MHFRKGISPPEVTISSNQNPSIVTAMLINNKMTSVEVPIFHADHGLTPAHWEFVSKLLEGWDGSFRIGAYPLPEELPALPLSLYGPAEGDLPVSESQVFYHPRLGRANVSRLTLRPMRSVKSLVLIAGPGPNGPTIYTVYGGSKPVEREVSDPTLPDAARASSEEFWAEHALVAPNLIFRVVEALKMGWLVKTGEVKVVGDEERMITDVTVGSKISYLVGGQGARVRTWDCYFSREFVFGNDGWVLEVIEEK